MFYKMIEAKRNKWLASGDCTVKTVIDYIGKANQMRDAQVEAIKTYLMAAFIYLDLYFARNEPKNPAFAHNFIIFEKF